MQLIIRIVISSLLVIHGFAHWHITSAWDSEPTETSWLLRNFGLDQASLHALGTVLWMMTLFAFITTGLVLFSGLSWWRPLAVVSSAMSLLTIGLFWQLNLGIGALVDVGILFALLWVNWPTTTWVGI